MESMNVQTKNDDKSDRYQRLNANHNSRNSQTLITLDKVDLQGE